MKSSRKSYLILPSIHRDEVEQSRAMILILLNLLFTIVTSTQVKPPEGPPGWRMVDRFYAFRFEIHGIVQGVWFRKSTQEKADELACFGWVQNTKSNTVVGEARCGKRMGPKFQEWLNHGPTSATVTRANIKVYEDTKIKLHFSDFAILNDDRKTCFQDDGPHSCAAIEEATNNDEMGDSESEHRPEL